ncbi:MAG: RpiB/LacA/LacB family sugar-phosphate isomerase [Fuerstiella sp.]
MKIGIACDHGGFPLKEEIKQAIIALGHECTDFGAPSLDPADDYPDYVIPMSKSVASAALDRGIALCGSGVGASIAANKVKGVRAAVIFEPFSARQGVEDDDMNVMCLGARVIGPAYALELVKLFLNAKYTGEERHARRLAKVLKEESSCDD